MISKGFTLIELLIVLAVVSIFAMIAVPAFQTSIQNNRMTSQSNEFLGMLYYARSEAVKRHESIQVCKSSNGTSCDTGLAWNDGWLMWVDVDEDAVLDVAEEIIRVGDALEAENDIYASADVANLIGFNKRGLATDMGSWQVCDTRGSAYAKAIVVGPSGRARVSEILHTGGGLTCS